MGLGLGLAWGGVTADDAILIVVLWVDRGGSAGSDTDLLTAGAADDSEIDPRLHLVMGVGGGAVGLGLAADGGPTSCAIEPSLPGPGDAPPASSITSESSSPPRRVRKPPPRDLMTICGVPGASALLPLLLADDASSAFTVASSPLSVAISLIATSCCAVRVATCFCKLEIAMDCVSSKAASAAEDDESNW